MKTRFTLFVASLLLLSACSKFENGPNLSLRSPEARLIGEWLATSETVGLDLEEVEVRLVVDDESFTFFIIEDGDQDIEYYPSWVINGNNIELYDEDGDFDVAAGIAWLSNRELTLVLEEGDLTFEKQ